MAKRLVCLTMTALLALTLESVAQTREVEVFYDRYGREILMDVYTGEVIAIREPRGGVYLREEYEPPRLRRERRMQELGRVPPRQRHFPEYRDYRALPDTDYQDYEDDYVYEDDPWSREPSFEGEPPPPEGFPTAREELASPRENDRVERQPLQENPSVAGIPDQTLPETVIEEGTPPASAIPDVTGQPQIGHGGASEDVAKIQVLLDRAGASPGVIDGRMGDNVNKAISAYRELTGETLRTYDKDYIDAKLAETGGEAFTTYEITAVDIAGPFVASIPEDYGRKAQMERMGFTSVPEMLAERFHMDERYLRALNPGVNFDRQGTRIKVTNVRQPRAGEVKRIVADKGQKQVRAYGDNGRLVAVYPSTIGSAATPSPTGTHTVERIAFNPEYTYNPKVNFQQGDNTRVLTIPPGPNGPVGTVWIALSKPTYGIHGTPEPSKIGKTESNGCIRLTNWDAQELAKMVSKGVTVEFVE